MSIKLEYLCCISSAQVEKEDLLSFTHLVDTQTSHLLGPVVFL